MWLATPSLYPSGIQLCYCKDGGDGDVDDDDDFRGWQQPSSCPFPAGIQLCYYKDDGDGDDDDDDDDLRGWRHVVSLSSWDSVMLL